MDNLLDEITHGCDGPVTAFVMISRAVELASRHGARGVLADDAVANALYEALTERGLLKRDDATTLALNTSD